MNGGRGPRGPLYDGIAKYAPFLVFILLALVLLASLRNYLDSRRDPSAVSSHPIDISRVNSAGMVRMMTQAQDDRPIARWRREHGK